VDDDPILASMRMTEAARQRELQPSATPLKDAIDRLGENGDGLALDVGRDTSGHAGVVVEGSKTLGKGWSIGGAFSYVRDAGYAAWGKVRWTPKSSSK
jgi:hypothetical protein